MRKSGIYLFLLILFFSCSKEKENSLFDSLNSSISGIDFENRLTNTDSLNIVDYLYFYNGGGVAIGDLNNDNLPDIILTANQSSDKIFINDGNLKFLDITIESGIDTSSCWSTGVTIADVNSDGWNDFYISKVGNYKGLKAKNSLYINQKDGTFKDLASEYGLDFSGFSTQANFFDYDNDGDLDCYLLNHSVKNPSVFAKASDIRNTNDNLAGDILYKNDNGIFRNVNEEAGIYSSSVGFGLGICTADFNKDGWQDIYVGNDFHENDYLYLNKQDGTFEEVASEVFGHTSNFTMGIAAQDINQDGSIDIFTCDMMPDDEAVFKKSGGWENIEIYNFKRTYGYHHQSPRNCLQINTGAEDLRFSEQACFYNLEATDWSWTPILADFDSNGKTDIFITNGISKRPNDMDFVNYMSDSNKDLNTKILIEKMPSGKVKNKMFLQDDGIFKEFEIGGLSCSTGAAIGDLDNDGDWDLVLNRINQKAEVLINTTNPEDYTSISILDSEGNPYQEGATITVFAGKKRSTWNANNATGFQSCNEDKLLIPESHDKIDSIHVIYGARGEAKQITFKEIDSKNSQLFLDKGSRIEKEISTKETSISNNRNPYFNEQTREKLLPFIYSNPKSSFPSRERNKFSESVSDYFSVQKLLESPEIIRLVYDDFNNDGKEDVYVSKRKDGVNVLNLQKDMYFESSKDSFKQVPIIGDFTTKNTAVVLAHDFENDNDIDLFIGVQNSFIEGENPVSSLLRINDGKGRFSSFPLNIYGAVQDAVWLDVDENGDKDLIIVGHWMPITILYFKGSQYRKVELPESIGLWNSCELIEIEGNKRLLMGNIGLNHRLNSVDLSLLRLDIDDNGASEYIMVYERDGKMYSYHNFETLASKFPIIRKFYPSHSSFAEVDFKDILSTLGISSFERIKLDIQTSSILELEKDFQIKALSAPFQKGMITAIESNDKDIYFGGNSSDFDPNWGRQDGFIPCRANYINGDLQIDTLFNGIRGEIMDIEIKRDSVYFLKKGMEVELVPVE